MSKFKHQCYQASCADVPLLLHPQRAAFWPAAQTLLVADVHLGKEQAFTRAGSAIPAGPSEADIDRLSKLIVDSNADRLLILGDLIHEPPDPLEAWLLKFSRFLNKHYQLSVEVVTGNHDKADGQCLLDDRIQWHPDAICEDAFVFQHKPGTDDRGHVLCGHVHPCYRLSAGRNDSIRAPVFWFGQQYSVLPSFGQFTGGYNVVPLRDDRLFMVGPECVVPVYG